MFTAKLYPFQEKHEDALLRKCADNEELVLSAPTGSGKTVLVCKFIDDYLDENPNTVFLWLCPGKGGLHKQSEESFEEVVTGIPNGDVYGFINETSPEGHVYFINWDKINRASNIALKEGEYKNLMAKVQYCHNKNIDIFMIIDEEHTNRTTANRYVANVNPVHVLRISATTVSEGNHKEIIDDEEVIDSGLIASGISINFGLSKLLEENNLLDDDLFLLKLADDKRKEIQAEYDKLGLNIRPLVLIQFPNGSDEWIKRVKDKLDEMGYSENSGLVTSWFSGDHPENPEEIKKLNGQYSFMLFKQAIATGWDCPRAKILVKLREGGTESFNIQTIGRIRRMPERKHYDNDLLDKCYLYTLDEKFNEGFKKTFGLFDNYQYEFKSESPSFNLVKECLDGSDRHAVNPKSVVEVVKKTMLEECDLDKNGILDKWELNEKKGFVFDTKLKIEAFSGTARTTHDMTQLNKIFAGEHEINNHDDGFIIRDAKRKIASAMGIDENISNNALKVLFGPYDGQMSLLSPEEKSYEKENKLLEGMTLREYNAFLVNNRDLLVDIFSKISQEEIGDIEETEIKIMEWSTPKHQYYKKHVNKDSDKIMKKNVFENYGDNILIQPNRSFPELRFEEWCENNNAVKWIYKNGDKGEDFFSLVYRKAFRRNNFYPDYIIQLQNEDIWIIETKGGLAQNGESNNIDQYAKNKFDSLKKYGEKHPEINWGFVRPIGNNLYLSNTEWDENVTNRDVWKPIEEFIKNDV